MSVRFGEREREERRERIGKPTIAVPPADGQGTRLVALSTCLERVTHTDLRDTQAYGQNALRASSFREWHRAARNLDHPDLIRNALYYGFQPLYDALIKDGAVPTKRRERAVAILDTVIEMSVNFLTSYYVGEPDIPAYRTGMEELEHQVDVLQDVPYQTKSRNIDTNGIYTRHIKSFLQQLLEHVLQGKLPLHDYVIGNACGASEIAMTIAGMLQTDVGFLRRSQARPDKQLRVIAEQEESIRERVIGKSVLCVEDYVDSGQSLEAVMKRAKMYEAVSVIGTSINFQYAGDRKRSVGLYREIGKKKFNVYRLQ